MSYEHACMIYSKYQVILLSKSFYLVPNFYSDILIKVTMTSCIVKIGIYVQG